MRWILLLHFARERGPCFMNGHSGRQATASNRRYPRPAAFLPMRGAFVIRLGAETKPSEDHLEGWVEEVDSGKELRFHSTGELIPFWVNAFARRFNHATSKWTSGGILAPVEKRNLETQKVFCGELSCTS